MASGIPTNRTNIELPNAVSREIIQKAQESSVVMRLARQIPLPGNGVQIPVITGDPAANWVAETGSKPVSNPSLSKKIMQAHKLAVIVPFSNEFRRDIPALYDALIARLPGALGKKFDQTVFFGPASGSLANFDNFSGVDVQSLSSSVYGGLVAADAAISEAGGIMDGIALAPQGKSVLLGALDTTNRPIFIDSIAEGAVPTVLGARTYVSGAAYKAGTAQVGSTPGDPDIVGFAGDWSKAMWGTVEGVVIDYSSDATLTYTSGSDTETVNLFQANMFAVRCEIEVGFVAQTDYFVALGRTHVG